MEQFSIKRRKLLTYSATTGASVMLAGVASPLLAQTTSVEASKGKWSPVYPWPDVAVHLNLLRNGKVMSFSGDDHGNTSSNFTKAFVVDIPPNQAPVANVTYINNTTSNMFCAGHAFLPSGQLIIMGGHAEEVGRGIADTNTLLHKADGTYAWSLLAPMNAGRWYPSTLSLSNGDVLVVGGSTTDETIVNKLPEVWQTYKGGGWRGLTTAQMSVPLYSRMHLAPDGRAFMTLPAKSTRFLSPNGTGAWSAPIERVYGERSTGCSVMYANGQILVVGGGLTPTATAEVISLYANPPKWRAVGSMKYARRHHNATLLADGSVLVTGGSSAPGNDATQAVLPAELWNPATGLWTELAPAKRARLYHSAAILLRDGRVLVGGGGNEAPIGGTTNRDVEIFSPPYLFKGPRPTIGSLSTYQNRYGMPFTVGTPDAASIARVNWVRLGSTTHGYDMNQRMNVLSFTKATSSLTVTAPSDSRLAPPGHYILFLISSLGVPSVGRIVQIF